MDELQSSPAYIVISKPASKAALSRSRSQPSIERIVDGPFIAPLC